MFQLTVKINFCKPQCEKTDYLITKNYMQKQERLDPGWAWTKKYNIGAGVKVEDTIYTSGLVALDSDGNVIGEDVYTQSSQVFKNIENLLVVAGATMADVIKINTFLKDMSQYGEFSKARNEAFPTGVPASAS